MVPSEGGTDYPLSASLCLFPNAHMQGEGGTLLISPCKSKVVGALLSNHMHLALVDDSSIVGHSF